MRFVLREGGYGVFYMGDIEGFRGLVVS